MFLYEILVNQFVGEVKVSKFALWFFAYCNRWINFYTDNLSDVDETKFK